MDNALKAISKTDDEIRAGNYIVLFGGRDLAGFTHVGAMRPTRKNADGTQGEYFTPKTNFESPHTAIGKLPEGWEHGFQSDEIAETVALGFVDWNTKRIDDKGVFVERVLNRRNEYVKWVEELLEAGLIGTSSEADPRLVKIKSNGEIEQWGLMGDTLTVSPAEPRNLTENQLRAYKALRGNKSLEIETLQADAQAAQEKGNASEAQENKPEAAIEIVAVSASSESAADKSQIAENSAKEQNEMDEIKNVLDAVNALREEITAQGAEIKAVKTALEQEPPINGSGAKAIVTKDPADIPFANIAENCKAVKDYTLSMGAVEAPRIKYLKATGASEGVPTDGGILLDPTLSAEFIAPIHQTGVFSSKVRRLPVSGNSNYGWINGVDETSRVAGSRWGGVRGYRLAESASLTASKPTFRRIQWELKKYGVLVYGTDELLADAAQWSAVINQAAREELAFMVNDDIMNGSGGAGAQGFMNSGALISVTRNTGSAVLHADILNMWNRLSPESRATAEWYIHNEVQPQLDALYFTGSTSVLSPFVGYRPDGVMTLYGRPVNVTEFNAALNTTGDIVLADLNQYLFWEKGGVQEATSIHVQFTTDEQVFRFIYRSDGKSAYASALTPYKGSTTTSPFVVLGSAT